MRKLFLSALAVATMFTSATAQDSTSSPLEFSGSVDAYFKNSTEGISPGSSFANGENGFNLGMVNLIAEKSGDKSGFVADLVFGPRGGDAVFLSQQSIVDTNGVTHTVNGSSTIINQLYAYWNVSDKLTLTLGNFNTFLGYEVISPTGNFNYSTSYMFSNGPFSHTGLKLDYAVSDDITLMASVMNATDATEGPLGVNTPSFGLQLGLYDAAWINVVLGDQDGDAKNSAGSTFQIDLTAGKDLSDDLYLGINTTFNTTTDGGLNNDGSTADGGFYGAALYTQYAITDALSAGIRGEYFAWTSGDMDATSVIDLTASLNYTVGNLTFIPEFRIDLSEDGWETTESIPTDLKYHSSIAQFYLAAVYAF